MGGSRAQCCNRQGKTGHSSTKKHGDTRPKTAPEPLARGSAGDASSGGGPPLAR